MSSNQASMPKVVSLQEWQRVQKEFVSEEKALTRRKDELNAKRRRLPMVRIEKDYVLQSRDQVVSLLDLFGAQRQLIVYHFMFAPEQDEGCPGCSWLADAMSHPAHLRARDTSLVMVSRAPTEKLLRYQERMGWPIPWYSSSSSDFNIDMGATIDGEESHGVSVFLRDGDDIFRSTFTGDRGIEHLGSHWTYLDLTPLGRQEEWEDSPPGWPQTQAYSWIRRHDDYT